MIVTRKLEYTDFSAGITENAVPGKQNAYAWADNLLITKDRQLESRPGSKVLSSTSASLPNGGQRVSGLINFMNDTELFAVSGPDFFYQDSTPAWQILLGPESERAFLLNTSASKVASADWRGHLFLTPDGGTSPQKVYRDENDVLRLRQAGLPKPTFLAPYTDSQLFNAAASMAEALRSSMILHFADSTAHVANQSSVAITALVAPTSVATLITYIATLNTAYTAHLTDALNLSFGRVYHLLGTTQPAIASTGFVGRYSTLNLLLDENIPTPTDIDSCVATLNDMRNRWNWHTYATLTHKDAYGAVVNQYSGAAYATNWTGLGHNQVTLPVISTEAAPVFDDASDALVTYVNRLKAEFVTHLSTENGVTPSGGHNNQDTDNATLPSDATDLHSAVILMAHLENAYWWHFIDANYFSEVLGAQHYTSFTGTSHTTTSVTATSIDGSIYVGYYGINAVFGFGVWTAGTTFLSGDMPVTVASGTATTVVFTGAVQYSSTATFAITTSKYHFAVDAAAASATTSFAYYTRLGALDYSLDDQSSLVTEATTLAGLIKSHVTSGLNKVVSPYDTELYYEVVTGHTGIPYHTTTPHAIDNTVGLVWPQNSILNVDGTYDYDYFEVALDLVSNLYTFVYRFNYNVGSVAFEDLSRPSDSAQVYRIASPKASNPSTAALYPTSISNIPALVNTPGTNYDTATIEVDIYRTLSNGQSFFLVGTVPNGTTTFTDSVLDTILLTNQPLYTTGGVVANDPPPQAKYIHILNGTAYYGNITEDGQSLPYRVRQSLNLDPDSCPATFFDDLDDDVTGLSSFRNYLVAFCKASFYRLENGFNELGQGFLSHEKLSDTVGCVGHSSIVRTEIGLFFCGTNGIYWTDGYTFTRITTELERTYAAMISTEAQKNRITGTYDSLRRRVLWTMTSSPTRPESDIVWVLDLNWGVTEKCSFTTWSGGTSFAPSSLAFYAGQILRGDSRGYIFKHDSSYRSDPKVDTTLSTSLWSLTPVVYDFQSCATDFGSGQAKKWVTRVTVRGKNNSNMSIDVSHKSDNNKGGWRSLKPIRYRPNISWGQPGILWDDTTCKWSYTGMMDEFRRIPAGALRCTWKAIRLTNAYLPVANSDTYGAGETGAWDPVAKTITFTLDFGHYLLPLYTVGNYKLSFVNDGYVKEYAVTARIGSPAGRALTLSDPDGTAPRSETGIKWVLRGIPLNEKFSLTSFDINFAPLSDEVKTVQAPGDVGDNA